MEEFDKKKSSRTIKNAKRVLFFGTIGALLLVSLTAFWLQRNIFNTEKFTALTTEALLQESSRDSIGNVVTGQILSNQPTLKMILGDKLSGQVSSLLGTELASNSINTVAREAQLIITSPAKKPLVLHLTAIKTALVSIQGVANRVGQSVPGNLSVNSIPDEIVIIDTSNIPNIHKVAVAINWLGPISLILAIVGLAVYIKRGGRENLLKRIQIVCLVFISTALVAMAIGPIAEPSIIAFAKDAPTQTLLGNIFSVFMGPFYKQALWVIGMSFVILVLVFAWEKILSQYKVKVVVTKKA